MSISNEYWKNRWEKGETEGFTQQEPNQFLVKYFSSFNLNPESVCFVPLCGASIDMTYLLERGMKVIGVELSEVAAQSFFTKHEISYVIGKTKDGHRVFESEKVSIVIADILKVTPKTFGVTFDFWYDRGGYIALPTEVRKQYALKMAELCQGKTKVLLITTTHNGPSDSAPYSISMEEMQQHFSSALNLEILEAFEREEMPKKHLKNGRTQQTFNIFQVNN